VAPILTHSPCWGISADKLLRLHKIKPSEREKRVNKEKSDHKEAWRLDGISPATIIPAIAPLAVPRPLAFLAFSTDTA